MAGYTSNKALVDPLCDLRGPALFPRTVIESGHLQMPADSNDLDSIHLFMKSIELRSPEKLLNEAKRIVNGGSELTNLSSFAEKNGVENATVSKVKDRLRERRPGLGISRKRDAFSIKAVVSATSVREPNMDIERLQDPDDFFDAYERLENAKKEIQKQVGGNCGTEIQRRPSLGRSQRPGILGKAYSYRHRYSPNLSHNDVHEVAQVNSKNSIDGPLVKVTSPGSIRSVDVKVTSPGSIRSADVKVVEQAGTRPDNKFSSILDELLLFDNEDLDEEGALNLVKERLNIRPLGLGSTIDVHDVGSSSISTVGQSLQEHRKDLASTLKRWPADEAETQNQINIASPTSPRSPFSSLKSLLNSIMKFSPLKDPFSPGVVDLFSSKDASMVQATSYLHEQVHTSKDLSLAHLDSHAVIENSEPVIPLIQNYSLE